MNHHVIKLVKYISYICVGWNDILCPNIYFTYIDFIPNCNCDVLVCVINSYLQTIQIFEYFCGVNLYIVSSLHLPRASLIDFECHCVWFLVKCSQLCDQINLFKFFVRFNDLQSCGHIVVVPLFETQFQVLTY
jgi:hypothetical protein